MLSWTKRLIKEISDSAMLYHGKQAHKQVFWLCFSSLGLPVPPRCLKSKASLQCLHRAPSIKTSKPNLHPHNNPAGSDNRNNIYEAMPQRNRYNGVSPFEHAQIRFTKVMNMGATKRLSSSRPMFNCPDAG